MSDKEVLRQQVRALRLAMPRDEVSGKSRKIFDYFIESIDFRTIQSVHIYQSIDRLNEVDSSLIIDFITRHQSHIDLFVQSARSDDTSPAVTFDLVVVPTLVFDAGCNRIGWGGGWYDRFLAKQPNAQKVGLCFENGRVEHVPTEPLDIKLDRIISEQGIIANHVDK